MQNYNIHISLDYSFEYLIACPRNTESLLAERLPILIDKVKDDDIILVTHSGPSKTGTTDVDMYPLQPSGAIESGR